MATTKISLPDSLKVWGEAQIERSNYASAEEYVCELVRHGR